MSPARNAPGSIFKMTSRPKISSWRIRKGFHRLNMSNAIRRWAWRRIRAELPMLLVWRSSPKPAAAPFLRPGPRSSARPTRRYLSALWPALIKASISNLSGVRPAITFAKENGADFVETGYWHRAQWFRRTGEAGWRDSVDREVITTRSSVGICDVSTLGKIDIQGADAGKFLNKDIREYIQHAQTRQMSDMD